MPVNCPCRMYLLLLLPIGTRCTCNFCVMSFDNFPQVLQLLRGTLSVKFESMEGSFDLAFKLSSGARLIHLFTPNTPLKVRAFVRC